MRVASARDLICGGYDYSTEDSEVQTIVDWRQEHGLACYESAAQFEDADEDD